VATAGLGAAWSGRRAPGVERVFAQPQTGLVMTARLTVAVAAGLLVLGASACRSPQSASPAAQPTVTASAAPSSQGSSKLDPEVPMPSGFPSDLPVYPGSRLTAGATFSSSGQTTWGMEWETRDGVDRVQAFYNDKFKQGDWTVSFNGSSNGSFSAVFARKSDSKIGGLVGASGVSGVTTITLSLVNAG
jgi:hypothetical protein